MGKYNERHSYELPGILQSLEDDTGFLKRAVNQYLAAPTIVTIDYTVLQTDDWIINNKPATPLILTLTDPAVNAGHYIKVSSWQVNGTNSTTANVIPQGGGAPGTTILSAAANKWAVMISNGVNWIIVQSN